MVEVKKDNQKTGENSSATKNRFSSDRIKEFENSYREEIKAKFQSYKAQEGSSSKLESRQYQEFKKQWMPKNYTLYEKACNFSEQIFKIDPDPKEAIELKRDIETCHLNVTPVGVKSFAFLGPIALILIVAVLSLLPLAFTDRKSTRLNSSH